MRVTSFLLLTSALFCSLTPSGHAQAGEPPAAAPEHPDVHLDRLEFPKDLLGAAGFEKHLRKVLKREAYRADWGAGSANRIEYRLVVEELRYTVEGHTLRIHCRAVGKLPGGQTAKSELTYGGDLAERVKLTHQVLEIVGRGVITRLAELERRRRGLR